MVVARKGALLSLAGIGSDGAQRGVVFQYNPDELRRQIDIDAGSVPKEKIDVTLVYDASDRRSDFQDDVDSTLAALEVLVKPEPLADAAGFLRRFFGTPLIPKPPILLFVYGEQRVVPVRVVRVQITEELHDPALRVVRARVDLVMRVVGTDEWNEDHPHATLLSGLESGRRQRAAAVFARLPPDLL